MIRQLIDRGNSLIAWTKKTRRVRLNGGVVKVNAGSSLSVIEGWINVDGSPHVLFAGWPEPVLKILYRVSDAKNWCGEPDSYLHQLKNHFLQCMSQRGGEMLREDMDALGPIKIKEVEASQQQIIAVVRQLETEGVISLKGTAGEQYVL